MCPQILAAATLGGASDDPSAIELLVFGRGIDNAIWYTSAAVADVAPSWPSNRTWESLGGGPFLGQPAALTWFDGERVSVVATSDPGHEVRMITFSGANMSTMVLDGWEDMGGPTASPLALCLVKGRRLDLWSAIGETVSHNFFVGNETYDAFWAPDESGEWQGSIDFNTVLTARPGVLCRPATFFHDLVIYGADNQVRHATYSDDKGWTPVSNRGGKFAGEPVVVAVGPDRFDFFGVGEKDSALYHFTWTTSGGYTALENVGGSFESVPSVVVTGSSAAPRLDVVALGTNDRLQHRTMVGTEWAMDWEDLGVFGNSAPMLVNISSTQPQRVAVFVIGDDGQVNQTMWQVSEEPSWQGLEWTTMGGNLTTSFYQM